MSDQWETGYRDGRNGKPCNHVNESDAYVFGWHEGRKARNSIAFRRLIKSIRWESEHAS